MIQPRDFEFVMSLMLEFEEHFTNMRDKMTALKRESGDDMFDKQIMYSKHALSVIDHMRALITRRFNSKVNLRKLHLLAPDDGNLADA